MVTKHSGESGHGGTAYANSHFDKADKVKRAPFPREEREKGGKDESRKKHLRENSDGS